MTPSESPSVRIDLVAFASAADALGTGELEVELPAGSTVEDLRRHLEERFPELARHWPRLAVAVDGELAAADAELPSGAEVALLPPVSGGAPGPDGEGRAPTSGAPLFPEGGPRAALTEEPLDVAAVTDAVRHPACGAVLIFLGTVRDSHRGRLVSHLAYSAYRTMARRRLGRIVEDLEQDHRTGGAGLRAAIVHRLGEVRAGQPSVVIAVASPHREAAYEASRRALERLKAEVPIWKKEHYGDGEATWREEEPLVV